MNRYAQCFNTLPVRPSIWRKLNRVGTQKLSNLSAIWLFFPSLFYGRGIWKSERLRSLFKTLQVQSGRVELGTQNVWLQNPDSSTVGCSLSLVLGWWSQSLKSTKPGFKSWLCHFPSWWQQASDKFLTVLQNEATNVVPINKAVAMFTEFYTYKGYYCPQSSTRKHTLCNDERKGGHYPEEAGGRRGFPQTEVCSGEALGPWGHGRRETRPCCLSDQAWTTLRHSWGKGPSVGKKGSDHKQSERQGQELALCPTGSQLHCEALGRAPWDQTQVSKVPLCLQDVEWTGG